jgi:hypothetical protein
LTCPDVPPSIVAEMPSALRWHARTGRLFAILIVAAAGVPVATRDPGLLWRGSEAVLAPLPSQPAPAQPASPGAQKVLSESGKRNARRQRVREFARTRLDMRMASFAGAFHAVAKARPARPDDAETEPRYLKIFLLATPDNHRSPPLV